MYWLLACLIREILDGAVLAVQALRNKNQLHDTPHIPLHTCVHFHTLKHIKMATIMRKGFTGAKVASRTVRAAKPARVASVKAMAFKVSSCWNCLTQTDITSQSSI